MTERWAIILTGDLADQADASRIFAEGPIRIRRSSDGSGNVILLADDLEAAREARDAHDIGRRIVSAINGALLVTRGYKSRLAAGTVLERDAMGAWSRGYPFVSDEACVTMRDSITIEDSRNGILATPATPIAQWIGKVSSDDKIMEVLAYLSGDQGWSDLYKAFELMRDDLNRRTGSRKYDRIGWPDTRHFQQSAQVHRHAAKDKQAGLTVETAMSLHDARNHVRELAKTWLAWRVDHMP